MFSIDLGQRLQRFAATIGGKVSDQWVVISDFPEQAFKWDLRDVLFYTTYPLVV